MDKISKSLFWILIFLSLILIFKIIKINFYNFSIPSFGSAVSPVTVNLETNAPLDNENYICFNTTCKKYSINTGNIYFAKYNRLDKGYTKNALIYTVLFFNNPKTIDDIENIYAYVGETNYYFSKDDILNFENTNIKIKNKTFYALKLPIETNFRGYLNAFSICFLSLFYNWKYFIIPYFCLFLAFFVYVSKRRQLKFGVAPALTVGAFVFLGVILRFAQINYYSLWMDEVYCKNIALESFKTCFFDPGNPPLFFLIEKISTSILSNSNIGLRFTPFLFGCIIIPFSYFLFKKITKDGQASLFAAFFMSVNTVSIYVSQEAKSTSMCMFFSAFAIYCLFKYLKNKNNKNLILYSISAFLLINSHYYLFIFAFANLIYIALKLYKKREIEELKKFLFVNLLLFLTFLPYFLNVYKISLNESFNTWIRPFGLKTMYDVIKLYFFNLRGFLIYILLISAQFVLLKNNSRFDLKVNENKKEFLKYLLFSISLTTLIIISISLFIKPIFNRRIFMSLYFLLFALDVLLFSTIFKLKKLKPKLGMLKYIYQIFVILVLFSITKPLNERGAFSFDYLFHFISNDPIQKEYRYISVIEDNEKYAKDFSSPKKVQWVTTDANHTKHEFNISDYLNSNKPTIMYIRYAALYKYKGRKDVKVKVYETNNRNIAKFIYK